MTLTEKIINEFDELFPCLVKPVKLPTKKVIMHDGEVLIEESVLEGSTYEKDKVARFLLSALTRVREATLEEKIGEVEKEKISTKGECDHEPLEKYCGICKDVRAFNQAIADVIKLLKK